MIFFWENAVSEGISGKDVKQSGNSGRNAYLASVCLLFLVWWMHWDTSSYGTDGTKKQKKTISWKTFRFHWSNCWGLEGPSATSWLPKAPKTCGLLRTCGKQKWSVTTSSAGCAGTQEHRHQAAYSKQYRTASCYNPKHVEASTSQPSCSLFGSIHTASWKISKDMVLMSTPRNQRIYH